MTESDEQVRIPRAIGDAYVAWVERWDGKIPFTPPEGDAPSDYPEHHLLHEFGHLAAWPIGLSLHDEAAAWLWALEEGRLAATATVGTMIESCMVYLAAASGWRTPEEATAAMPELLRPVQDRLWSALRELRPQLATASSQT